VSIKSAIRNAIPGATNEQSLRADIERCAAAVTLATQKQAGAEKRHSLAIAAVKAENERLSALEEAGEEPDLSALGDLEQAEGVAAKLLDFAHTSVAGAKARLASAEMKLDEFLIEEAKSEASQRLTELAAIITDQLKPAYLAAIKARSAAEARGVREWVAIPGIDSLLAAAAEMTNPAPATPAKLDPLRSVTFIQSTRIDRGLGGHHYSAGEPAGFEPWLAAKLVFEERAIWTHPGDPRQVELIEQARANAASPRPRPATGLSFGVVGTAAGYLDGAA
jgi:hypothetical protein